MRRTKSPEQNLNVKKQKEATLRLSKAYDRYFEETGRVPGRNLLVLLSSCSRDTASKFLYGREKWRARRALLKGQKLARRLKTIKRFDSMGDDEKVIEKAKTQKPRRVKFRLDMELMPWYKSLPHKNKSKIMNEVIILSQLSEQKQVLEARLVAVRAEMVKQKALIVELGG